MDTAIIRQGELVGRSLMAYETTEAVGTVDHLLVDVQRGFVVGLVYKAGGLIARKQTLQWSQLAKIGRDSIIFHVSDTHSADESDVSTAPVQNPLSAAQDMTGLEVWTDGGDHIGRVVDLCLDVATGEVQQYLFMLHFAPVTTLEGEKTVGEETVAEDAAEHEAVVVYAIAPNTIISAGRKRMMIAEEEAKRAQPYAQPLEIPAATHSQNRLEWKPEQLPDMPTDWPADWNELLQKGQSLAGKVTQQVKVRAKQFTDEQLAHQDFVEGDSLPDITEQLQAKTEQVKQQMQSRFKTVRDKAKDQLDTQLGGESLEDKLGKTSLGRSLGQTLDKSLNRFKRPQPPNNSEPIDVESFEVWEDD